MLLMNVIQTVDTHEFSKIDLMPTLSESTLINQMSFRNQVKN